MKRKKNKTPRIAQSVTATGAHAVHASDDAGHHLVDIGNIRVFVVRDGDHWFAQGLEIDYSAQGNTVEAAQRNFQRGLLLTIQAHLRAYGGIDRLLQFSPPHAVREFLNCLHRFRFSHTSVHFTDLSGPSEFTQQVKAQLPYSGIDFYAQAA